MSYCFFFSYATGDDPEAKRHQHDFFRDLSSAIKGNRHYDRASAEIGFLDAEIPTGSEWTPRVSKALMTCRVFVYLQEPAYFTFADRPWCGREWKTFRDRLDEHARATGGNAERPPLMIPIIWRDMVGLPQPAADIQFKQHGFGEVYSRLGLYEMKSRPETIPAYLTCVTLIADHVVSVVNAHRLAPATRLAKFADITDPFSPTAVTPSATAATGTGTGPRYVDFVYVVEEKKHLQPHRQQLTGYDATGDPNFWRPYDPPDQSIVARIAETTAHHQSFMPERILCGPGLVGDLDRSLKAQRMVVLIVDPWSLMVNACRTVMESFWRINYWNTIILIPWHVAGETDPKAQEVSGLIDEVFFDWHAGRLRTGISSKEELVTNLEAAFLAIQEKFLKRETFRKVEGAGLLALPGLSAVGG